MKRLLLALLAIAALLSTGCATRTKLTGFSLTLESITPAADGSAVMRVRYSNDNIIPIAADSTEHRLFLHGRAIATIKSDAPVGLPPTSSQPGDVRLDASVVAAIRQVVAQAGPSAPYQLDSRLLFEDAVEKYHANARGSGTVDLSAFQP